MDDNKIPVKCRDCRHKKQNSIFYKLSEKDAEDWGAILMWSSAIIGGIIAAYYAYQNIGFFPTSMIVCATIFIIGLFMKLICF